jgi:hypothetical protein
VKRREIVGLAVLLVLGALLRAALVAEWRPAFLGFADSLPYLGNSRGGVFWSDSFRSVGYIAFLALVRSVQDALTFTVIVQHAMGLLTAVLLFATVRAVGGPRWLGLIPAGLVALHGSTIFLEHSILSESLFSLLLAIAVLAGVLALRRDTAPRTVIALAALAGAALALSGAVRGNGIPLAAVPAVILLAAAPGSWRLRAAAGATTVLAALAVFAGLIAWGKSESPRASLAPRSSYYNLYGRVSGFADCSRFTPPKGTERLCITVPPDERMGFLYWIFSRESPIVRTYGEGYRGDQPAYAEDRVNAFAKAAILGQPLDYAEALLEDTWRIVDPHHPVAIEDNSTAGYMPDVLADQLLDPGNAQLTAPVVEQLYSTHLGAHEGDAGWLSDYERITRTTGAPMLIVLALALVAPLVAVPGRRAAALLLAGLGLAPVLTAIALVGYDWRFVVPSLGLLWAAAALAGHGLATRWR